MLIQFGQAFHDYIYDVFVAKFDFWLAFGLVAQLFFTARFRYNGFPANAPDRAWCRWRSGSFRWVAA